MVFAIDDEVNDQFPPELYASTFLSPPRNVFERIWIAIKYVFGYKSKYGHFDCFSMAPEDATRFVVLLKKYIKLHNKFIRKLKNKEKP